MWSWLAEPEAWVALLTLTSLEIVLGIDNIIFLSILVGRLPAAQREKARIIGLAAAMIMRIGLLLALSWVMGLTTPWIEFWTYSLSGRDLILLGGGLFLLVKSTLEIHHAMEDAADTDSRLKTTTSFFSTIVQIMLLDIIFSLDSVITAVGMAEHLPVMVIAVILSVAVMMIAARSISEFVEQHPTIKMLALSFLIMIGIALVGEGLALHIPKGYIYFAMAFSITVEMLNLRLRKLSRTRRAALAKTE